MEFLPPEGTPKGAGSNSQPYLYTRVRLAWYYRPSDVSDRAVSDSRLLLAAIYSEVCDINQLRAKCHVVHRDKITDLAGWKKRPDRFYFNRLFDPYIKKEFEVIQATDVRNLPENIRETLISRYEYVVAEKEVVPELTDAIRLCDTCTEWCESAIGARSTSHAMCPATFVGETIAWIRLDVRPLFKQHEEEVDSHDVRHPTPTITKPKSNAPPVRGRGRPRKDRGQAEGRRICLLSTLICGPSDTSDPDDLIFPRTATRQGPKYQANVPLAPDPNAIMSTDPDERGGDSTIQILSVTNTLTDAEVESYKDHLSSNEELKHGVDWLTEVIRRYSDAIMTSRPLSTWKKNETRYTDKEWSKEEKYAFEEGIFMHGAELRAVREEVGTRQMPEVVRYYGHWKKCVYPVPLAEVLTLCIAPNWARRTAAFSARASPRSLQASGTRVYRMRTTASAWAYPTTTPRSSNLPRRLFVAHAAHVNPRPGGRHPSISPRMRYASLAA
ncbi:PHD type zinc finger protein with BAH domain-containing protein [Salix suchowensis]|nr:PHD type zinc finger protein with BAH domain-containing protein [Salix suchowensis]